MIERGLVCVRVCVCVTLSLRAWRKSIDLQLELDRLPLPSDGQTLWPSKVHRQVLGIACRCTLCLLSVLLHKCLSSFFLFLSVIDLLCVRVRFSRALLCSVRNVCWSLGSREPPRSRATVTFFFGKPVKEIIDQKFVS